MCHSEGISPKNPPKIDSVDSSLALRMTSILMKPNLKVKIGRLELKNPIAVASGTLGYGEEFNDNFYKISELGALFTKGISLKPRHGNSTPRVVETASGMLNAIGLQNVGLEVFINEKLPYLRKAGATAIVNIFGEKIEDYVELARSLDKLEGISGFELNISCPNVKAGGVHFGTDPKLAAKVTKEVKKAAKKHLMVKLSPNYHDMVGMAKSVVDAGADSLSLINTITGMAIDAENRSPVLANITGGLSGPAIKPVALRMVWQVSKALPKVPIVGIGGIMNITDVVEFLLAGASAVQVGTANFVRPSIASDLVMELEGYLSSHNIKDVNELVAGLKS